MASRLAKVQAETQPTPAENGQPIRVIIADSQAIFRVGIRKVLAVEEDLRVVAQAETLDAARLRYSLLARALFKSNRFHLSPASIRNIMADLTDGGYLAQPHTSAGRVPTDRAYRLYIDELMRHRKIAVDVRGRTRT